MIGEVTTQLSSRSTSKRAGLYCKAAQFFHIHLTTTLSQKKLYICISGNLTLPNFLGEIYHFFHVFSKKKLGGTGIKYLY